MWIVNLDRPLFSHNICYGIESRFFPPSPLFEATSFPSPFNKNSPKTSSGARRLVSPFDYIVTLPPLQYSLCVYQLFFFPFKRKSPFFLFLSFQGPPPHRNSLLFAPSKLWPYPLHLNKNYFHLFRFFSLSMNLPPFNYWINSTSPKYYCVRPFLLSSAPIFF